MPCGENSTQLLHTASGALVGLVVLVASAGYFLGIGLDQPEQFLDVRHWEQAVNDCLHAF